MMTWKTIKTPMGGGKVVVAAVMAVTMAWGAYVPVRDPGDVRAWQVVLDVDSPLVWPWADGAVAATVSVSNLVSGATYVSESIARSGSLDGSYGIPAAAGESLFDVTLVQTDGESVVKSETVRLKVGSQATVYADSAAKGFARLAEPRIYPWSDMWLDASAGAETATLSTSVKAGASLGIWTLPAPGGYGVLSPKSQFANRSGWTTATLAFDGTDRWSADLYVGIPGLTVILR